MSFYRDRVLPWLIHLSMRHRNLTEYRQRVIPRARGHILEIGAGSGLNFSLYGAGAERVIALDPSHRLLRIASREVRKALVPVELLEASAEAIPLPDASVDTVVTTWTLCSIGDIGRALREVRRVLRPDGRLLFVEHGRSKDAAVQRWQDRLTPLWRCIGGGCHLNRPIASLIEAAGLHIDRLETGYMKGPKLLTFMYEGVARP